MTATESTTQTRRVMSSELQVGDVLREHGMRVRIESVRQVPSWGSNRDSYPLVTCAVGAVLNPEAVREAGIVPMSFLHCEIDGHPEFCWHVQGNDLATWYVEA